MADGSVHFVQDEIDYEVFHALAKRNGGESFSSEADIYNGEWHHVAWMIDVDGTPVTLTVRQEGPTEAQKLTNFEYPLQIGTGGRARAF